MPCPQVRLKAHGIKGEVTYAQDLAPLLPFGSQPGTNPGEEFGQRERLGQVALRAESSSTPHGVRRILALIYSSQRERSTLSRRARRAPAAPLASARRATRKRPPHYSQAPAAPPLNTRRRAASYPVITTIWSSRAADLADHMKYSEHCVRERVQGGFCACFLAVCGLAKAACRHWLAKWSGRSTARFEEARW
ncbi:MAG TPA: hypothetical protein VLW50_23695 [Streptosporangiaceae bacterium]|nr:hypothetical protein [Streptosporangiaceae bacterium]